MFPLNVVLQIKLIMKECFARFYSLHDEYIIIIKNRIK